MKKIQPSGICTSYVSGVYEVEKATCASGTPTKTTTYYPVAGAMRINNDVYYVLKDHLGSASVVTDSSGNVVGEQRYYPFGGTRWSMGSMLTDKLYTGQREMAGLGIYHYGARFYSPTLGRFLSADTIIPGAANPQSFNRYSYVLNNPLRYIDPTGHDRFSTCGSNRYCMDWVDEHPLNLDRPPDYKNDPCPGMKGVVAGICASGSHGDNLEPDRPINGVHSGTSLTFDLVVGKYHYEQVDNLFDWKSGIFYKMRTTGDGYYVGSPNGAEFEGYHGWTSVHGIPMSDTPVQVKDRLSGSNFDLALDAGVDVADLDLNGGKGLSVDLDPDTGKPVITNAGPMYAIETKIGGGVSVLPFPIDIGIQGGTSETVVEEAIPLPWWPFR